MRQGEIVYHGRRGEAVFEEEQPAFFTPNQEAAQWYAQNRGNWEDEPCIHAATLDIHNPASYDDLIATIADTGMTAEDVQRHSPYEGDNVLDFLYIPEIRQILEWQGFDGYVGWDVLTN